MEENERANIKEDARIVRTKRDLANALEELLMEKGIDQISVKDITDKALISKNTFYNNFNDKNELLIFLFERYEAALIKEIKPILDKAFYATRIFSFKKAVESIVHFFYTTSLPIKEIIKHDSSKVLFYTLDVFIQDVFKRLEKNYEKFLTKKVNSVITSHFYAGAFASTIYFAYTNDLNISEKEIARDLVRLSLPIVE